MQKGLKITPNNPGPKEDPTKPGGVFPQVLTFCNWMFYYFRERNIYIKDLTAAGRVIKHGQQKEKHWMAFKELQQAISFFHLRMPVIYRAVFVLRDHEQLRWKEIELVQDRPRCTTETHKRRGRPRFFLANHNNSIFNNRKLKHEKKFLKDAVEISQAGNAISPLLN